MFKNVYAMLVPFCGALLAILPAASFSSEDICFGRLTREVIHQQEPCKCKKGGRAGSQAGSGLWHYGQEWAAVLGGPGGGLAGLGNRRNRPARSCCSRDT